MTNLLKNLKWGLRWGLTIAVAFTVIGVLATLAAGFETQDTRGPSLVSLIGFYFLGGACGGLMVGLLRPVTRNKAGAMVVGTLVTAALLSLMDYVYVIKDHWTSVDTVLVAVCSLVAGPITTLMIWEGRSQMRKARRDVNEF